MDANVMKRMIVLKNLQSNIVEEAYVVFKNNVKVHKYEKVDNIDKKQIENKSKNKDYIVKEAEMIVNDYIKNIEDKDYKSNFRMLKQNYKRLKMETVSLAVFSILTFLLLIIK